jgi:L-lactate dehydrogenase complex protein LldF
MTVLNVLPNKIGETLADSKLQTAIYTATGRLVTKRKESIAPLDDYQELRTRAHALKKHTLENLDYYLEQVEANVAAHGGRVVFCRDASEVCDFVLELAKARSARILVKSKSMTSEEVNLNERLEHHQLEAVETDLGEYILQLANERPYHIVAPALHKTRYDVADIFTKKLGVAREVVVEKQTLIAREKLRQKFLAADIGISGANFIVADSGAVVIVENEGNARLSTSAPKIHIAIAGIEKLIPRAQDLGVFLKLLGRSATGQPLTVYTSFLSGPRREGEVDGPDEFYLVLLDNGRTKLLADKDKRESLYCIRCGACLNHCPVFRKIGGHSYPWVYSGPIGAIITPQFAGIKHDPWLPFASSLCGACAEVCPVKIDIPRILLELRHEVVEAKGRDGENRLEKLAFRAYAWVMRHPRIYELAGLAARTMAPDSEWSGGAPRWIGKLPGLLNRGPAAAWLSERDLPPPAPRSFREMWRERQSTMARREANSASR